jgi:hypothetical protein
MLTTSTNRNILQPTKDHKQRRRSEIKEGLRKGKNRSNSPSDSSSHHNAIEAKLKQNKPRSPSASGKSDRSQLIDLVVEDTEAEEIERVRARKEGSDAWNREPQRHFIRTYDVDEEHPERQDIREGFDPAKLPSRPPPPERAISDDENNFVERAGNGEASKHNGQAHYPDLDGDQNVWK